MKKRCLLLMGVSFSILISWSPVLAGSNPKGKPFVAINDQIVAVNGAVSGLQEQISSLVASVDSIEGRVAADEDAINLLNSQNIALRALINSNFTDLVSVNAEVESLNQENYDLRYQISQNTGDVGTLQGQIDANSAFIDTLNASILMIENGQISFAVNLQEQIDNNKKLIDGLNSEVLAINNKLMEKQNMINGVCPEGEAAKQVLPDGTLVCGAAGGAVNSGELEMERPYKSSFEDDRGYVSTGTIVKVNVFCEAGWIASGSGIGQAFGWVMNKNATEGSDPTSGLSWASVEGRNDNPYMDYFTAVANCIRIKP